MSIFYKKLLSLLSLIFIFTSFDRRESIIDFIVYKRPYFLTVSPKSPVSISSDDESIHLGKLTYHPFFIAVSANRSPDPLSGNTITSFPLLFIISACALDILF